MAPATPPLAPHFRNLRLEPNLLRLSWDGDVTSGSRYVHCQKGANSPVRVSRRGFRGAEPACQSAARSCQSSKGVPAVSQSAAPPHDCPSPLP